MFSKDHPVTKSLMDALACLGYEPFADWEERYPTSRATWFAGSDGGDYERCGVYTTGRWPCFYVAFYDAAGGDSVSETQSRDEQWQLAESIAAIYTIIPTTTFV